MDGMINISNMTFGYKKGAQDVFKDFSLTLQGGRVYGLLGRNGAGKSTLIHLMSGLLTPTKGAVMVDGVDVRRRLPSTLSEIFVVPEEFELPETTLDNFVKLNAPFYPKFNRGEMDEYLKIFDVPAGKVNLKSLSMGQKKKVFLSFALATNTRILIMDEPTNGLDIMSKSQFRKVIAKSVTDDKVLLLSTHQVRDVDTLLDHVLIVDHSQVMLNAGIEEIGRRLAFKVTNDVEGAIYWQQAIGGNLVVKPNVDGEETVVEIESLYNAVMYNPQLVKQLFEEK